MDDSPAFNLDDYELSEGDSHQETIPVMIPRTPFRIHTDPGRVSKVLLSRFDRRHWWLIRKAVAKAVRVPNPWVTLLHHGVLLDGTNFILPLTLPRDGNGYEDYCNSLKKAIRMARKQWVTALPDNDVKCYRLSTDANTWIEPEWIEGDWADFIELGFYDHLVATPEQARSLFRPQSRLPIEEE